MNTVGNINQLTSHREDRSNLESVFASFVKPLPVFLCSAEIISSITLYRYTPEQIAMMLNALSKAMQAEHYRHDGELSDALHDHGERVADIATDLRVYAEREME